MASHHWISGGGEKCVQSEVEEVRLGTCLFSLLHRPRSLPTPTPLNKSFTSLQVWGDKAAHVFQGQILYSIKAD